jgi:2,3-bisphosphoglycerate-independent phosphoglycerate mutase
MSKISGISKRVVLLICDGMGFSENTNKNAVKDANTPTLDRLLKEYPNTLLIPGGEAVGLPKGIAGNSEVGHINIGAGRSVRQDLVRINEAIENKTLESMPKMQELIKGPKRVHLMGLLSDGGVHSHINHLKELAIILSKHGKEIFLHAFMDGRDTEQTKGIGYINEVLSWKNIKIASIGGRSLGMDRDQRWEKIKKSYDVQVGKAHCTQLSPEDYIQEQYSKEIYDEFIQPALFIKEGAVREDDSIFFINFRPDRAKQTSFAFVDPNFTHFDNSTRPTYYLCMSPYIDEEFPKVPILFDREKVSNTLAKVLSDQGKTQLKIAETEKYAHVTYFFNGGEQEPFKGEERILINSPSDVATYDLKPQMSAYEVTEKLCDAINHEKYDVYICNLANPDMVGHTGNYQAAVEAMEHVDKCLQSIYEACTKTNTTLMITADHGNCDQMVYPNGAPHTSHSNASVPFIFINEKLKNVKLETAIKEAALKDIAPTILNILQIDSPSQFEGHSIY